ncbi:hypothetical protein D9M68_662410 [compost metagenome]
MGAETAPFAVVLQAEYHGLAVAREVLPIGRDRGMRHAVARGWGAAVMREVQGIGSPFRQRFQHGHLDAQACAGASALYERRQDAGIGIHAGGDIGDGDARACRGFGRAGQGDQAGSRLYQQVIGLLVAVGAVIAVARNVAHDQPGEVRAQRVVVQAHAARGARREILDEDISLAQQAPQHLRGARSLGVQG